jgi:hypothetical protein
MSHRSFTMGQQCGKAPGMRRRIRKNRRLEIAGNLSNRPDQRPKEKIQKIENQGKSKQIDENRSLQDC